MYTDDTKLIGGKYNRCEVSTVPPEYLLNVYYNSFKGDVSVTSKNPGLINYIGLNLDKIKAMESIPADQRVGMAKPFMNKGPDYSFVENTKKIPMKLTHVLRCSYPGCMETFKMDFVAGSSYNWFCEHHIDVPISDEVLYKNVESPREITVTDPYNDNTIITHGEHKFTSLKRVDPEYLLEIFRSSNKKDIRLYKYVQDNLQLIKDRRDGKVRVERFSVKVSTKLIGSKEVPVCKAANKLMFASQEDADKEMRRLKRLKTDNKKPQRSYQCPSCSFFHLTSMESWAK